MDKLIDIDSKYDRITDDVYVGDIPLDKYLLTCEIIQDIKRNIYRNIDTIINIVFKMSFYYDADTCIQIIQQYNYNYGYISVIVFDVINEKYGNFINMLIKMGYTNINTLCKLYDSEQLLHLLVKSNINIMEKYVLDVIISSGERLNKLRKKDIERYELAMYSYYYIYEHYYNNKLIVFNENILKNLANLNKECIRLLMKCMESDLVDNTDCFKFISYVLNVDTNLNETNLICLFRIVFEKGNCQDMFNNIINGLKSYQKKLSKIEIFIKVAREYDVTITVDDVIKIFKDVGCFVDDIKIFNLSGDDEKIVLNKLFKFYGTQLNSEQIKIMGIDSNIFSILIERYDNSKVADKNLIDISKIYKPTQDDFINNIHSIRSNLYLMKICVSIGFVVDDKILELICMNGSLPVVKYAIKKFQLKPTDKCLDNALSVKNNAKLAEYLVIEHKVKVTKQSLSIYMKNNGGKLGIILINNFS